MKLWRIRVDGYERSAKANTELEAKQAALTSLRHQGHSLRQLKSDGSESYDLAKEVHALEMGGT